MSLNNSPSENTWTNFESEMIKVSQVEHKLTPEQAERFKDIYLTPEQAEKLKNWNFTIEELTRLETDQLRKEIDWKKRMDDSISLLRKAQRNWEQQDGIDEEYANWLLDSLETSNWWSIESIKDSIWEKAEKAKKVVEKAWIWGKFWEVFKWAEKAFKKEWALAWIIAFFVWLWKMLTWGLTIDKAWEKMEELSLNSDELKETQEKVKTKIITSIESSLWEELDEDTKAKIEKKLNPKNPDAILTNSDLNRLYDKIEKWESLTTDDLHELWILTKIYNDPELKDILNKTVIKLRKGMLDKMLPVFESRGINMQWDNKNKFEQILKREINDNDIFELIKNWKGSTLDVLFWSIGLATMYPSILLECYKEDLLKVWDLVITAWEYWSDKIQIWLKAMTWDNIIWDIVWTMQWGSFDWVLEKLSPEKKLLLYRSFYAELWIVAWVMWAWAFALSSWIISTLEMWEKVKLWVNPLKEPSKLLTKPADRLSKTLEILNPGEWAWIDEIKDTMKLAEESYRKLDEMKTATPEWKKKLAEEIRDIQWKISTTYSEKWSLTNPKSYKWLSNTPLKSYYARNILKDLENIAITNSKLATSVETWNISKLAHKSKQIIDSFKVRYIWANAVLRVSDNNDAKTLARAMWTLSPEILRWLLWKVPVIMMAGSMIDMYNESKENSSIWDLILSTNGIFGWLMLLEEWKINLEGGLKVENMWSASLWLLVMGTEVTLITKDILKWIYKDGLIKWWAKWLWIGLINSAFRVPVEMINFWRWWIARWAEIYKIASAVMRKSPKKWLWIAIAGMAWLVLLSRWVMAEEVNEETLKEQEIIDENWNFKDRILWDIDDKWKKKVLDLISMQFLANKFKWREDEFSFDFNNWVYTIKTTQEILQNNEKLFWEIEKSIWEFAMESWVNINVNFKT